MIETTLWIKRKQFSGTDFWIMRNGWDAHFSMHNGWDAHFSMRNGWDAHFSMRNGKNTLLGQLCIHDPHK